MQGPIKQICLTHFQFSPGLCEEIQNSRGKQHLSSSRPLLSSENVPKTPAFTSTRAQLLSGKISARGQARSPAHRSCGHFPPCRTVTERPDTRDKTRPGSSRPPSAVPAGNAGPAFPAARRAGAASEATRRHCVVQTEPQRESPLRGRLREGIVLFMRREEKIKLPCCFLFARDEGQEEGSLVFGG